MNEQAHAEVNAEADDGVRWGIPQIAVELGFGRQAVKKWRSNTLTVLRKFGQVGSPAPTCPLPKNALPVPDNQAEHVRDKDIPPRWKPQTIIAWAELTGRRNPDTGQTMWPSPPGLAPGTRRALEPAA